MSASPDIFLSYNREDAEVAKLFADAFASEGMEVWWDVTLRSGETYDEVTEAALRGAKAVVVLWSPRSVASHWVRAEATIAHRAKTLIPATIEPCDKPVMFELTQTADLSHWRGEAGDPAWQAFLGDVRRMVGTEARDPEAKPAPAPAPAGGDIPIVAVLPIASRGDDLEFLAEDLTDEITRELSRSHYFKVTAAGIMAVWRGKQVDYRVLGREVGARYLAEGKLQRAGENIRLTMQLIETSTGSVPWSKRFIRKADEVEETPEEFAAAVVAELGEHAVQVEINRAMKKSGPYTGLEHVLRAMAFISVPGLETNRKAVSESRQAVAIAPDLALAHAELAANLSSSVTTQGEVLDDALRGEIRTHAARALELDGHNPLVIGILVTAYWALGDGETCLRLARRRLKMEPNSTRAHNILGIAYMILGRTSEAIAAYEQLNRLTPDDLFRHSALSSLAICYLAEGRMDEAEDMLDQSLALRPDYHTALKWKAIILTERGDEEGAHAAVIRLKEAEPDKTIDHHIRQIRALTGRLADSLAEYIETFRRLWAATESEAKSA